MKLPNPIQRIKKQLPPKKEFRLINACRVKQSIVALACKAIARAVAMGELGGLYGDHAAQEGGAVNVQGETQKKLDVLSNDLFIRVNEWAGHLAGMASE
ncbi:MAG: hypothetical protein EBU56_01655, partial [Burkholderiaceae bacterium]|nr:hypothetical protein [Burkholderiaceae bacterium]